jgi:arylsulfatase A-like enzyme
MSQSACTLLASILLCAASAPALAQASAPPNVLVILADDLGWDSVGCYGLGLRNIPTPRLDALASAGVRFTRAYVNPACSPTRGCLMTGRYGFRNGVPTTIGPNDPGPHADEVLLPQLLAGSGYARALIGKWHLGREYGDATPNVRGWPHFAGVIDAGIPDYYRWPKVVDGQASWCTTYATTDEVNDALAWIGGQTTPWFLMLSLCAPHAPFQAPPAHLHTHALSGLDATTNPRPFFEAMVEAMDCEIGRLLMSMDPATLANTNIIFLGDNGTDPALALPPFQASKVKGSLYEGAIRVPMIVAGPAVAAPGRVSAALVSAVDLFVTIAELCGIPPAALPPSPAGPLDGVSICPLLSNTVAAVRGYVYADMKYSYSGGGYTVVDDLYALLRVQQTGPQHQEFYEVDTDPYENTNLLAAPLSPPDNAAYRRLLGILASLRQDGWVENVGVGCGPATGPMPSLRSQTMPRIGTMFFPCIENISPVGTWAWLAIGRTTAVTPLGAPPVPLDVIGMPGCTGYTYNDLAWEQFANPQPVGGYLAIPLPFIGELVGYEFLMQAFVEDPRFNSAGLVATNGQHGVIGW